MIIKILCDQTDCIYNKWGHTGHDYLLERMCYHPKGVIITKENDVFTKYKGCLSKEILGDLPMDTETRENILRFVLDD